MLICGLAGSASICFSRKPWGEAISHRKGMNFGIATSGKGKLYVHNPQLPSMALFFLSGIRNKKSLTVYGKAFEVPKVGIEPTLPKEHDFESCASTNSATLAFGGVQRYACCNFCTTSNYLYPLGLLDCHFQASRHISSTPRVAFQPNSFSALAGSA